MREYEFVMPRMFDLELYGPLASAIITNSSSHMNESIFRIVERAGTGQQIIIRQTFLIDQHLDLFVEVFKLYQVEKE